MIAAPQGTAGKKMEGWGGEGNGRGEETGMNGKEWKEREDRGG